MDPSSIHTKSEGGPIEAEPRPDPSLGEGRSFAPAAGELKDEFLEFVELELHRPVMSAEPHPFSEDHRRRLLGAQKAVHAEMERLRACESAEEIALTLLRRIEAGVLDELDEDVRFLGFRSLEDLGGELAGRARAAGMDCERPARRRAASGANDGKAGRTEERKRSVTGAREAHQERLLDEGVEETFPASDPVSVSRVDP